MTTKPYTHLHCPVCGRIFPMYLAISGGELEYPLCPYCHNEYAYEEGADWLIWAFFIVAVMVFMGIAGCLAYANWPGIQEFLRGIL